MRLGALLVAFLTAAVSAGAQGFEASAGRVARTVSVSARQARLDLARRKKALPNPPAGIVLGGPKDRHRGEEPSDFEGGWREVMRLLANDTDCLKFFQDHGDGYDKVIQTLQGTSYYFYKMEDGVGAATIDAGTVFINTDGVFVTATNGGIVLDRRRYDLGEASSVRAMVLLHELGHQLGIFGIDGGPELQDVNAAHSLDIIRACMPSGAIPKI